MTLGTEVYLCPGPPLFGLRLLWPNDRPSQLLLSSCNLPHLHFAPLFGNRFSFCRDLRHQKAIDFLRYSVALFA